MSIHTDVDNFSLERTNLLILPTLIAWFELLYELHNFMYNLAIFVSAIFKVRSFEHTANKLIKFRLLHTLFDL